jgi:uncharacterized phosphosugar-binding protein
MLMDRYWQEVESLFAKVKNTQRDNIIRASRLIADAVDSGACVHIHDSGHIIDSELIYRGGGLILYKKFKYNLVVENPVRKRNREDIDTSMEGLAAYALKASGAKPGDVFILGSVSGRSFGNQRPKSSTYLRKERCSYIFDTVYHSLDSVQRPNDSKLHHFQYHKVLQLHFFQSSSLPSSHQFV